MPTLTRATCRRLKQLPQIPSVWEGDRRPLSAGSATSVGLDMPEDGECILWVDGSQAVVRAMDMVPGEAGTEAVVRVLLQAMEHPHGPIPPARPQKIIVRDRELQFFLRGVLQDLDIVVDYVPDLPLIDEIFKGFEEAAEVQQPQLSPEYAEALREKAYAIWKDAPWQFLAEHQIVSIELNRWDIGTLYASIMGMLGVEYGILFYRSLESLKQFRQEIISNDSPEQMQEAFLKQDCMFVTFEPDEDLEEDDNLFLDWTGLPLSSIQPNFGNLHPLERMRSFLYDEEAIAILVALEALHRFFHQHRQKFSMGEFPVVSSRYRIPTPENADAIVGNGSKKGQAQQVSVQVSTLPEVATELFEMVEEEDGPFPFLRDDLVPEDALRWLEVLDWDVVDQLRDSNSAEPADDFSAKNSKHRGEGLPIVVIQTSQPKAKALIQAIQEAGGLNAICFNPGEDPFAGVSYDLGILQTQDEQFYLFEEFVEENAAYTSARKKWERICKKNKGRCGLVVAKGVTGAARGKPQPKDMLALFEARSLSAEELGLGPLELQLATDWI